MSISLRELFGRQEINGEVISLRNSLANHHGGLQLSLREAHRRFLLENSADGYAKGCCREGTVSIDFLIGSKSVSEVLPAWVSVTGDVASETRTLEGILTRSSVPSSDFPFKPWHTAYDWNLDVRLDKQYTYLYSQSNSKNHDVVMECEWDTAFLPSWAFPQEGDRVWIVGRWIYDCGHPKDLGHKSEIHPPKAIASFRKEAIQFAENRGPTQANIAVLFIGREGGYWRQPINDRDYSFDLYLPPKPYPEAAPVWRIDPQTGPLPVAPRIVPYPENNPRALRVTIPLKGVNPHPENYGAMIWGGWSDPRGTEATKVKRVRVTIEEILMDANLDPGMFDRDEWTVYIGINGRWQIWNDLSGDSANLNYSVELHLSPDDRIHITACGREADEIDNLMGKDIGLSWADICDRSKIEANAKKIRDGFFSLGFSLDKNIENEEISDFSAFHPPMPLSSVVMSSRGGDYRLRYKIESF